MQIVIFIDFFLYIDSEQRGVRIKTDGFIFDLTMQMLIIQGKVFYTNWKNRNSLVILCEYRHVKFRYIFSPVYTKKKRSISRIPNNRRI